ncbi:CopG family transcriptional regulator [bacterium]|nr:CopG family transcriptional regulator [bacterium]
MAARKVAITLDERVLGEVDRMVSQQEFPSRSRAIESLVSQKLRERNRSRLAEECARLDPKEEKRLADEGLTVDSWPEY